MSLTFNSRRDCLHQNLAAFAALGVVAARPVPAAECLDCAYAALRLAMNPSPSRPELAWQLLGIVVDSPATGDRWRVMLIRDYDRARVNGYNGTLAGVLTAAANHLNERAYRLPLGEPVPLDLAHFDDWKDAEGGPTLPECGE